MPISRRRPAILVTLCLAGGLAEADERPLPRPATGTSATVAAPLLTPVQVPVYGTRDYRVTVVAAADFASVSSDFSTSVDTATLSRYCWGWCLDYGQHYYATLDVPAGAIIDYIGVNTATTGDAVMGFSLLSRDPGGGVANLATFSFPAHGFQTDFAGPLDIPVPAHHDRALILDVEQAPSRTGSTSVMSRSGGGSLSQRRPRRRPSATCPRHTPSTSTSRRSRGPGSREAAATATSAPIRP